MCVAIAQRQNAVTLTPDELERGWRVNSDGGGYGYIDRASGKIVIKKFMKMKKFIKNYTRDHRKYRKHSPFVVHMRIATHGDVAEDTTHPFRIATDSGEAIFAHNGIINGVLPYTDETKSDTMAFRDLFLDQLPDDWMENSAMMELVEDYIGWSKMVVLTTSDNCSEEIYVINEVSGTWVKENWFSNSSCEKPKPKKVYDYAKATAKGKHYQRGPITYPSKEGDGLFNKDYDYDDGYYGGGKSWKSWLDDEPYTSKETSLPAMSLVVRAKMNELMVDDTDYQTLIEAALEAGYCEYCLFAPCRCATTCYYCNDRWEICHCAQKSLASIADMIGWVGEEVFHEVRHEEIMNEYCQWWDEVAEKENLVQPPKALATVTKLPEVMNVP